MQKNGNYNKQSLWPQCNQVRTQNSETNSEPHSLMETDQLDLECWLDKQWNEGRNKKVLQNQQERKPQHTRISGTHLKQSLEENI